MSLSIADLLKLPSLSNTEIYGAKDMEILEQKN
jgi:hypothetical protein